ncbi:unnamed protein product [Clavelina lepadiformis]|uniref:Uncharacterized protein n=1 Tax=Clavelina lepadiformis TaxID=159417 RepID=A0ABP0FA49_CLALP
MNLTTVTSTVLPVSSDSTVVTDTGRSSSASSGVTGSVSTMAATSVASFTSISPIAVTDSTNTITTNKVSSVTTVVGVFDSIVYTQLQLASFQNAFSTEFRSNLNTALDSMYNNVSQTARRKRATVTYTTEIVTSVNEPTNTLVVTASYTVRNVNNNGLISANEAVALISSVSNEDYELFLNDAGIQATVLSKAVTTEPVTPSSTTTDWVLPVVIVLGVLLGLCIVGFVILFSYRYYSKRKKGKTTITPRKMEDDDEFRKEKELRLQAERENDYLQEKLNQLESGHQGTVAEAPISYSEQPSTSQLVREAPKDYLAPIAKVDDSDNTITTVTSYDEIPEKQQKRRSKGAHESEVLKEHPSIWFQPFAPRKEHSGSDGSETSRFQTSVHPILLPPIETKLVSEQIRQNLGEAALKQRSEIEHHRNKVRIRKQYSYRYKLDPDGDKYAARTYAAAQQSIDRALEPSQPSVFDLPSRTKARMGRQKQNRIPAIEPIKDPDLKLLLKDHVGPLGQYTRIDPFETKPPTARNAEDQSVTETQQSSPDENRQRLASLLGDAFGLVSPTAPLSTAEPTASPLSQIQPPTFPARTSFVAMPAPHGRGSATVPHQRRVIPVSLSTQATPQPAQQPLFTRTHPPLVQTSQTEAGEPFYVSQPSSSGQMAYVTPLKKVPNPPGKDIWTPYQAFDEVSKLREELTGPSMPEDILPNTAVSPSLDRRLSTSPNHSDDNQRLSTSVSGRISPVSDNASDCSVKSNSSAAHLVKDIKEELARLVRQSTPVENLSDSNDDTPATK